MQTQPEVQHQSDQHRFILATDGEEAVLDYRLVLDGDTGEPAAVNFTHTYVPPDFRGKGLAESLVRQGLKWAREQDYEIQASCWYVAKFLRKQ